MRFSSPSQPLAAGIGFHRENSNMENAFSTIGEISEYLKLKPSTLYAMVAEKRIPHFKIGRLVRFKKAEIDLWLENHRKESVSINVGKFLKARKPSVPVDRIVRKAIDQVKAMDYNPVTGKPDQIKGLGREDLHGTL